jgi:hypothetical protein
MAKGTFEISKDAGGEYRWLLRAPNGEPIADSSEGYKAHRDCAKGLQLVIKYSKTAKVEDLTGEAKAAPAKKKAAKKKAAKKK